MKGPLSLGVLGLLLGLIAAGCSSARQPVQTPAAPARGDARPAVSLGPSLTVTRELPATPSPAPEPIRVTTNAISRGNPGLPEVALVFNGGAGFEPAWEIPDILHTERVPATFFVMGWLARKNPELVRNLALGGFEVASHGDQVFDLTAVSDAAILDDLQSADRAISALIGHTTRPLWSPSAGYQDERVRRLAAGIGYDTLLWTVDSGDWRTDATPAAIEANVIPRLQNGTIVVLHIDSTHSRDGTVPALYQILAALRARGLTPVSMSTLLRHLDGASQNQ